MISLLALVSAVIGADSRYALQSEFNLLAMEFKVDRLSDEEKYVEERIWKLEAKYKINEVMSLDDRLEVKELELRLKKIRREIDALYGRS